MKPARKWTSIVFASAIALSYLIAQRSHEAHTRSLAPVTLSRIHLVEGTIYSSQGDPRTADPAHIAKDTVGSRRESVLLSDCAAAAPGNLMGHYNRRLCSLLRDVDRRLYLYEFAGGIDPSHGIPSEPVRH